MSVYKVTTPGDGLLYVRFCTEQATVNGERVDCHLCHQYPHWGNCKIKGRFLWKDYGGKEGALEAAKAFIQELKRKEA